MHGTRGPLRRCDFPRALELWVVPSVQDGVRGDRQLRGVRKAACGRSDGAPPLSRCLRLHRASGAAS